jgi:hypothetical protein
MMKKEAWIVSIKRLFSNFLRILQIIPLFLATVLLSGHPS